MIVFQYHKNIKYFFKTLVVYACVMTVQPHFLHFLHSIIIASAVTVY